MALHSPALADVFWPGRRRSWVRTRTIGIVVSCVAFALQAMAQPTGEEVGQPWRGEAGIGTTTAELMARQKQETPRPHPVHQRLKPDFQSLLANPEAPNVSAWPPEASEQTTALTAGNPQTFGLNFTAATLADSA